MHVLEIFLIAVGLAMDAFAASITLGLSEKNMSTNKIILPGIYFGIFQALMPAIGYFSGIYLANIIANFDHWIAFILLGFIGGKMIKDSLSKKHKEKLSGDAFRFVKMLVLALATSIDALAVGITYAFFNVNIIAAAAITGIVTFFISTAGVKIGHIFGTKFKTKAEFTGGAILIIIGIEILVGHLFFK